MRHSVVVSPPTRSGQTADTTVLAKAVIATTAGVLPAFLTGAVGVQLRADLGFGEAGLGLAVAAFFAGGASGSVVLGRLTQRLGPTGALQVGGLVAATTNLAIAVGARSLTALAALLAFGGLGNAISQPAANLLLANRLPADRLGLALGIKQSGMPLATLLGGLAVPGLAQTVGWEAAYLAAAAVALVSMVWLSTEHEPARAVVGRHRPETPTLSLAVLGLGMFFGAAAAGALTAFLVSSAEASGVGAAEAGLLLSGGAACGIVVRVTVGIRADRRPGRHLLTVSAMLALGAVAFALLAVHEPAVVVAATPLAFGAGWAWPGLFNFAVVRANPRAAAAATGVTQTGVYLGALVGPVGFGLVVDAAGYSTAWLATAASALLAATVFAGSERFLQSLDSPPRR